MIFSAEKWNKGREIKELIKVSAALTFEMMEAPLRNAYDAYLRPLLGDEMLEVLENIYKSEIRSVEESRLLFFAQKANANLAFWTDFDAINTRITDAGFQRQESEDGSFKQAYKYQEDALRNSFKAKGFNGLDDMLALLEDNIELFSEYEHSPAHIQTLNAFVKSSEEVNRYYLINSSRIIFLRLSTHLNFVVNLQLPAVLGDKLYAELMTKLDGSDERFENLRKICLGFVVNAAIKRLLSETGSITDRGLYFHTASYNEGGSSQPVPNERLNLQLSSLDNDITAYKAVLTRYVRNMFTEFYEGDSGCVLHRNNDNKKTFWA